LFELPNKIQDLDQFDLKKAKRKYQLLHPDKSGLPNHYFLFYQKAYQKIEDEYLYYHPTATKPTLENGNSNPAMTYQPYQPTTTVDKRTQKQVSTALQSMRPEEFQRHMNQMYEEHMATKQDTRRADWMRQDAPTFENLPTTLKSQDDIANQMAKIKQQQQNQLIRHRQPGEVEYLTHSHGQRFYDDDDDDEDEEALDKYITSDPFSKLKFEDVRKVHGAETILLEPSQQQQSQPQRTYQQQKQEFSQTIQPMDKTQSQALLEKLQKEAQIKAEKARQNSMYKIQNYEEKNKTILNSFLRIGNGNASSNI
jgi:hypothetical protein